MLSYVLPRNVIEVSAKVVSIDASFCLFPRKEYGTATMIECIGKGIRNESIRKERFFLR